MTVYSLHQRHHDDARDLEQLLIAAHRRLDERDIARGITRYPSPFTLEENNGNHPSIR
jgi:hypothetical protein